LLVFVYGTLKRGFYNHEVLETSQFIGKAITKNKYPMINDLTLEKLDILEDFPDFYTRDYIQVIVNNNTMEVIVYFLNENIDYTKYELLEEFIV